MAILVSLETTPLIELNRFLFLKFVSILVGVHMSTMNPTLARYCNKVRQSSRKIPEKEGVMIEKVRTSL